MTLSELILECGEINNPSIHVQLQWPQFINRAVRVIAQKKDWKFLLDRRPYVILTGDHSVSLGPQFKCLSEEESPISVTYTSGGSSYNLPVAVISRELSEQTLYWPNINQIVGGPPVPGGYIPIRVVFLEWSKGECRLHIPEPFVVVPDSPYNVTAYYYPNPLKLGTDTNPITEDPNLCEAVINFAVARSFFAEDRTSKQGQAAMAEFKEFFTQSDYTDSAERWSGRALRM